MSINRLFEIVYLLLEQKSVTAAELAERFEVSVRTVYRDLDALSAAGIPVYACRGRGGGIKLTEGFTLDKSLLSAKERGEILAALQGLDAIRAPDAAPVLQKLAALFGGTRSDWLRVDFSRWGSGAEEQKKFALLKAAVLEKRVLDFRYCGADGRDTERVAEPVRLLFKGQGWYLWGFCRVRQGWRAFKITRMRDIRPTGETFDRAARDEPPEPAGETFAGPTRPLRLRFEPALAFRVFDEFSQNQITRAADGGFVVEADFPDGEWLYGYLLSFGGGAEVLEPDELRRELKRRLGEMLRRYQE